MNGINLIFGRETQYLFETKLFSSISFYNITPTMDIVLITWWHALIPLDRIIDDFTRLAIKSFI